MPRVGKALKPSSALARALGERFRQTRKYRSLTLQNMADALGVTIYLIRCHEAGSMMMRTDLLVRAAKFMNVRPGELVSVEEENERTEV